MTELYSTEQIMNYSHLNSTFIAISCCFTFSGYGTYMLLWSRVVCRNHLYLPAYVKGVALDNALDYRANTLLTLTIDCRD